MGKKSENKKSKNALFIDSYIFAVESEDIDHDLKALEDVMDFSTYDKNHHLFNDKHKSELGRYVLVLFFLFLKLKS